MIYFPIFRKARQGVTENDSSFKRYKFKMWEIRYDFNFSFS